MGRQYNDDDDVGEKLHANADFDGPTEKRHCTDVLCMLLVVAMWGVMTALGVYAISNGDYRIVVYPLDYDGNICGTDFRKDFTEYPYLWFINNYAGGVCLKECPKLQNITADDATDIRTMITYGEVWQTTGAELPSSFGEIMANYSDSEDAIFCTEETCFPDANDASTSWTSEGVNEAWGYAYYTADSYPLLWRCFITVDASDKIRQAVSANSTLDAAEGGKSFWNNLYADLWTSRAYILGFGFGVALVVSLAYIFFLRLPVLLNFVVWSSIFIAIAMFFLAGYYAYAQAQTWQDEVPQTYADSTINATRYASYAMFAVGGLLFLIMCCLRKQIQLAVGTVKETGRAVNRMPTILLVPVVQAAGFVAFLVVFIVYGVHLASLGEITTQDFNVGGKEIAFRLYEFDDFIERSAWYLLFCLFWTGNFVVAVGDMVIAMCIAKWYFTRDKKRVGAGTVWGSFGQTLYYHLGTCAYGALVISLIQILRSILAKIQKKAKAADSKVADALLCCCQCCLWCFEKCMKFLNKNAYIQTAIFGTSFCTSAREAFFLILRNAARIAAITYVSGAVLVIGKLFISSVTTGLSYFVMNEFIGDELHSVGGPVIFVFLISWFISDMFMDVFHMAETAMLQCFVADEEMFDGDECFAEGALRKFIDEYEDD